MYTFTHGKLHQNKLHCSTENNTAMLITTRKIKAKLNIRVPFSSNNNDNVNNWVDDSNVFGNIGICK